MKKTGLCGRSLCVGLAWLGLSLVVQAQSLQTIRVGTGEWEPFTGKALAQGGPVNQIADELFKALGYKAEFSFQPWPTVYTMIGAGQLDVSSCAWKAKEREAVFLFGEPVLDGKVVFVKRKGDPWTFNGFDSLTGKKVGTIAGYGYGHQFLNASNFIRQEYPDLSVALSRLADGSIDLTLDDEMVVTHHLTQKNPVLQKSITVDDKAILRFPCYLALSRSVPHAAELRAQMDRQIRRMKADQSIHKTLIFHGLKK